ncbi:recombination protein NinB [Roseibium album]|uniref:recombination protein NinB n=1 Tax=Roseibium album TaxID=311410 RepID=UPI003BB1E490
MTRAVVILNNPADRKKAADWATVAPAGTRVEFKKAKRTLPQNDRFWAMLTDISTQLDWHGKRLTPDDWKLVFLDALRREMKQELRMVPSLDGSGFVPLGNSSSNLTIAEMGDLMEIMSAFGTNHGVRFQDDQEAA